MAEWSQPQRARLHTMEFNVAGPVQPLADEVASLLAQNPGQWGLVIRDLEGSAGLEWQAERVFYPASLIKVPVMVAAFAAAAAGTLDLDERIPLRLADQVAGSGVLQYLGPGLAPSILDLITLMIIVSDNAATNILIDRLGPERVNETMARLGLSATRLHHKLMVMPAEPHPSNTTSAADMSRLFELIATGRAVSWDASRRMIRILKGQQFQDGIPLLLPETVRERPLGAAPAWEVANKTGWVPGLVHDVGIVYTPHKTFLVAALSEGVPTAEQARRLIGRIARLSYDFFTRQAAPANAGEQQGGRR